jgi:hypothetical protein
MKICQICHKKFCEFRPRAIPEAIEADPSKTSNSPE